MYIAVNFVIQDGVNEYGEYLWRKIKNQNDDIVYPVLKNMMSEIYGEEPKGIAPDYVIDQGDRIIIVDSFIFFKNKKGLKDFFINRSQG